MNLIILCGKIAAMVSAMVVMVAIVLLILVIALTCLGAYESYTNTGISVQSAQEYSNLSTQINAGAAQINHAVPGSGT
jgi:hypothetical protein